jgi:hypothetical protein
MFYVEEHLVGSFNPKTTKVGKTQKAKKKTN